MKQPKIPFRVAKPVHIRTILMPTALATLCAIALTLSPGVEAVPTPAARPARTPMTATVQTQVDYGVHLQNLGRAAAKLGEGHVLVEIPILRACLAISQTAQSLRTRQHTVNRSAGDTTADRAIPGLVRQAQMAEREAEGIADSLGIGKTFRLCQALLIYPAAKAATPPEAVALCNTVNVGNLSPDQRPSKLAPVMSGHHRARRDILSSAGLLLPIFVSAWDRVWEAMVDVADEFADGVETAAETIWGPATVTTYRNYNTTEAVQVLSRQKRQLLLGLGFVATAALGVYNTIELASIRRDARKAAQERRLIATALTEVDNRVHHLTTDVLQIADEVMNTEVALDLYASANNAAQTCTVIVSHLRSVVDMALSGRLDVSLVQHHILDKQLGEIAHLAKRQGLRPVQVHTWDLSALPTSFAVDAKGKLVLFTHVPLTSDKLTNMELWQVRQLPVETSAGWFRIALETPFVTMASEPTGVFTAFTEEEFARCHKYSGVTICPFRMEHLKDQASAVGLDSRRCAHSLVVQDEAAMMRHCHLQHLPEDEISTSLGPNTAALYTGTSEALRLKCGDSDPTITHVQGINIIQIPQGCSADTNARFLWPFTTVVATTRAADRALKMPSPIARLRNATAAHLNRIKFIKASLKDQLADDGTQMAWLRDHLRDIGVNGVMDGTGSLITTLAIFGSIAIAAGAAYCCWRKRDQIRSSAATRLPTPPTALQSWTVNNCTFQPPAANAPRRAESNLYDAHQANVYQTMAQIRAEREREEDEDFAAVTAPENRVHPTNTPPPGRALPLRPNPTAQGLPP